MKKSLIVAIAIAVAVSGLLSLLIKPLVAGLIGFTIGFIVAVVLIARSRGERVRDVTEEVVSQVVCPDPGAEERLVHEQLCRLNQRVRLDGQVAPMVLKKTEELMDLLRNVVPRAQQEASGTETTFDLMSFAVTHFPRLVDEYLELSPGDRSGKAEQLVSTLDEMIAHVKKVREYLDRGQREQFEAASGFVDLKFS